MSEYTLAPSAPPDVDLRLDGLSVQPVALTTFVCISTQAAESKELARFFEGVHGLSIPEIGRLTRKENGGISLLRAWADQLVVFAEHGDAPVTVLPEGLAGAAFLTDQSDAWTFLRLSGRQTAPLFERLCALDLESARHRPGSVAQTVISHVGVYVIRDDAMTFLLGIPRSYTAHFLDELAAAVGLLGRAAGPT